MAVIGITADETGLTAAGGGDAAAALARAAARLSPGAPVVVLVHGYRFTPFRPDRPADDPHLTLYAPRPQQASWKAPSWSQGLGYGDDDAGGLCVGFAWHAVEPLAASLLRTGRSGFARVYDRAGVMGACLAQLVTTLQTLLPGREIDVLAHSLGARVALAALAGLERAPGRMVLLGAAEFEGRARAALAACPAPRPPEVYNVTSRANDVYDAAFEACAPRRGRDRAVGSGLANSLPCWLDIQLDRREVTDWINAHGVALRPAGARFCHWSFYTRGGAFEVYRAILGRRPGWDVASLRRAAPFLAGQEPRWSRLPLGLRRRPSLAIGAGARLDPA